MKQWPMVAFCAGPHTSGRWRTQNATSTAVTPCASSSATEPVSTVSQCSWLDHDELADSRRTSRHQALRRDGRANVTVSVSTLYCTSAGRSTVSAKHTHRPPRVMYCTDSVVVLCSTQHKIGHFGGVPQANLSAWYGKTKPNTTKARIHQSKEMYYKSLQ